MKPPKESTVERLRREARAVEPLAKSGLVKELLAAAADLPAQKPRRLWHDLRKTRFYKEAQLAGLAGADVGAGRVVDHPALHARTRGTD